MPPERARERDRDAQKWRVGGKDKKAGERRGERWRGEREIFLVSNRPTADQHHIMILVHLEGEAQS